MQMFTYVLFDKENNLYKIGRSTNPRARFRQLCRPGRVRPIHVFKGDIEGKLHDRFADQRLFTHPDPEYADGHTEWFRSGGKLQGFVDELEVQDVHFYTPQGLYNYLEDSDKIIIPEVAVMKRLESADYYRYSTGRKILNMLGYLYYNGVGYDTCHANVKMHGAKIFLTDSVLTDIAASYTVEIVGNRFTHTLQKFASRYGNKVFTRRIDVLDDGTSIYIVVAKIK